jgi:hypothetical protein
MKNDIIIKLDGNLVSIKYYNEEFGMSFGHDPTIKPDIVSIFTALDFLIYLIKKKHKGKYHDLSVYSNGRITYNGERFKNSKFLLLRSMGKEV